MDEGRVCEGVVECTALVLAQSCAEHDGRMTLFGILDEIEPSRDGGGSFVVYTKFEGCEHAAGKERQARILVSDEEGEVLMESEGYSIHLDGTEEPVTVVASFEMPEKFTSGDRVIWLEAVLDDETLSQTAIPLHEKYNV